jgi:hypothetical protein
MQPPPCVAAPSGHVCHLRCALYGLKQTPCAWFECFPSAIMPAGFIPSHHYSALFIHHSSHSHTFLLLYVDDMLITGDDVTPTFYKNKILST